MASLECRRISCLKHGLGVAFMNSHFALKDIHQLIFVTVPVLDGRVGPRLQDVDERPKQREAPRMNR